MSSQLKTREQRMADELLAFGFRILEPRKGKDRTAVLKKLTIEYARLLKEIMEGGNE